MRNRPDYRQKFDSIAQKTLFLRLPQEHQTVVRELAFRHRFTLQDLRQATEIVRDLTMWGDDDILTDLPEEMPAAGKIEKKRLMGWLQARWEAFRSAPNHYYQRAKRKPAGEIKARVLLREKPQLGLGFCPVASPRTRCCNLLTLDAVDNCGYHCSYCSIQSFFGGHQVFFDNDFPRKLASLQIDPHKIYHIGTGQSSDSLMWGNSHGALDALVQFAGRHPNVILELKTKSANIARLLALDLPANLICTWSLNPQTIIDNEELGSAALEKRLEAAGEIADKGNLVGFHFHPMIHYQGWQGEYGEIFARLQKLFLPGQVAMTSLGTLTFTRSVIRKIREKGGNSQILKLPLVEADGKLSYPDEIKRELFGFAYDSFSEAWRRSVFFYLCMENQRLWMPVFGFQYDSNESFEKAMQENYLAKITLIERQRVSDQSSGMHRLASDRSLRQR